MARFKVVTMFLLAVLFAMIVWGFLLRAIASLHPDNALVKGLVATNVV